MGDPQPQTLDYDAAIARRVWAAHKGKSYKELQTRIDTVPRTERPYVRLLMAFLHTPWIRLELHNEDDGPWETEENFLAFAKPRVQGMPPEKGEEDPVGGRKRRRKTQKRKATQKRRKSRRTH